MSDFGYQKTPSARKRLWGEANIAEAENLNIVLVHPKRGSNVGASARAMNNFGFKNLVIACSKVYDEREAINLAKDSETIVETARYEPDLNTIIDECVLAVGTTARAIKAKRGIVTIKEAAPKIASALKNGKVALLFGPEWRGLSDKEIERCSLVVTIPTGGPQPSLNLAQAVSIICYEVFQTLAEPPSEPVPFDVADEKMLEGFWNHLEDMLKYIDFLPPAGRKRMKHTFRDLLYRAQPDQREVKIMRGIIRKLTWHIQQVPKKTKNVKPEPDTET